MAVIDRVQILADTKTYLPAQNVLTDQELNNIINNVIDFRIPEDDNIYYSQALCWVLEAAAILNQAKFQVDSAGLKRQKDGGSEDEWFDRSKSNPWNEYIKNLPDICPYLPGGGYSQNRAIGIFINPGKKPQTDNCSCSKVLHL